MADLQIKAERSTADSSAPKPAVRSMTTLLAGIVFTAIGLAVVLDEISGLDLAQTASLAGLAAAVAVLAAAVSRAGRSKQAIPAPQGYQTGDGAPLGANDLAADDPDAAEFDPDTLDHDPVDSDIVDVVGDDLDDTGDRDAD